MATWVSQLQSWELLRRLQEVMMFVLFLSRVNSALPGKLSFWRHDPWPQPYMLVMLQVQVSQVSSHTRQMWGAIAFPVSLKGMMRVSAVMRRRCWEASTRTLLPGRTTWRLSFFAGGLWKDLRPLTRYRKA